jgi:cytochrome c-type biogenesis protein CcmH/NrfF
MKQTLPGNPKFIRTNWRNILLWLVPVIALLTSHTGANETDQRTGDNHFFSQCCRTGGRENNGKI